MDRRFTILIDSACPLCRSEAVLLRLLDRRRGRLVIEDISKPDFDHAAVNRTHDQLMATIHGVTAEGEVITGMPVFRSAYRAVGLGWLLAPTGWPLLRPVFDALYRAFARFRLHLACRSGRACSVSPN